MKKKKHLIHFFLRFGCSRVLGNIDIWHLVSVIFFGPCSVVSKKKKKWMPFTGGNYYFEPVGTEKNSLRYLKPETIE